MLIFELVYLGYQVVRIFSIGIASYGTGMGILVGVLNCVQIVVPVLNMFWFFHAMKTRLSGKQKETPERIPGTVQSASSGVRHCTSQMCHLW